MPSKTIESYGLPGQSVSLLRKGGGKTPFSGVTGEMEQCASVGSDR